MLRRGHGWRSVPLVLIAVVRIQKRFQRAALQDAAALFDHVDDIVQHRAVFTGVLAGQGLTDLCLGWFFA